MSMGLSLGLRLGGSWIGGGAAVPTISDVVFDDDELSFTATGSEPMTMHYVSTGSATPPSAATIIDTPDGTVSLAGGVNYLDTLTLETDPGTWYLHFVVTNAAGQSEVSTVSYVSPALGFAFTETWSGFTVGDANTQIKAGGYSIQTPESVCAIVSDGESPSGKALTGSGNSGDGRYVSRDDITTQIGAGGWSEVQFLVKLRSTGATGARAAFGFNVTSTTVYGLSIRRGSGGTQYGLALAKNINTENPDLILASNIADNSIRWFRLRFSGGDKLDGKMWVDGDSEPTEWSSQVTAASAWSSLLNRLGPVPVVNTATGIHCLGYSIGIDREAPAF
jgi:hypothetical protein